MNERYEKWLDEQLKKTIDSGKVEFDRERWRQKYSAEYHALVSRAVNRPNELRFLWVRPLVRVAAIIAIVALVIFITPHQSDKRVEPMVVTKYEQSPVMMMSRLSLMRAYERGGMDAVDEQFEKAFRMLGTKTSKVSVNELLNEDDGEKPVFDPEVWTRRERKDL